MLNRQYDYDEIYNWIVRYKISNQGNSPSIRDIKAAFNITSTSVVNYILERLQESGRISRSNIKGKTRSIVVVGYRFSRKDDYVDSDWCF